MTDVRAAQEALVTYKLTKWLSAHCPDHDTFVAGCWRCEAMPQCCPRHPQVNGTFPGFDLGCQACMATRPGYEDIGEVGETLTTAEQACMELGIPNVRRRSGTVLRLPLNLLRRAR